MDKPPRRILHDFQIMELSAVNTPAQEPALAHIAKAAKAVENNEVTVTKPSEIDTKALNDGLARTLAKMYVDPADGPVSFAEMVMEQSREQAYYDELDKLRPYLCALETSVRSIAGDASIDVDQRYSMIRNQVEAFMTELRACWLGIDEALATYVKSKNMEVQVTDKTEKAGDEAQAQIDELTKKLEAAEAQIAKHNAIASLSPEEADFYKSLSGESKEAFLTKSAEDRAADLRKASDDETVDIEGQTVRKSVIGSEMFAILKAQSARMAKAEKLAKDEREKRELQEFTKAADDLYSALPGTSVEKAKALVELSKCSAETQDVIEKMLKAGASANAEAFEDTGHTGGHDAVSTSKATKASVEAHPFIQKVNKLAADERLNKADAMSKARGMYPDDFKSYRESA